MAENIDFRALRAVVTVSSVKDPRWNFQVSREGHAPPDQFSLRGDIVNEATDRLYKLQENIGVPGDLLFKVEEEWSVPVRQVLATVDVRGS